MPYQVYLKRGEEKRILAGHSWVYANEVAKIEGKDKTVRLPKFFPLTAGISARDISIIFPRS